MRLLITGGSGFIGTNLVEHYLAKGVELINLDWNPPLNLDHSPYHVECDIMDREKMLEVFTSFQPTHVVHLAARADTDEEKDINLYIQNTAGTRYVLDVIKQTPSVERAIITSTQFVCKAGYMPKDDEDYDPFTLYGYTKVLTEQYTREAGLNCAWTIIRPTTVWGPWSLRYRDVLFRVLKSGLYMHPDKNNVRRSYGYIGNVVYQIEQILEGPVEKVDRQVFYVGDPPVDLKNWVNVISRHLTGRNVRTVPTALVRLIALGGDILGAAGIGFPITSSRFRSMTQDYITPIDKTIKVLGQPPYDIESGVQEMVEWYNTRSAGVAHPERIIADMPKQEASTPV